MGVERYRVCLVLRMLTERKFSKVFADMCVSIVGFDQRKTTKFFIVAVQEIHPDVDF